MVAQICSVKASYTFASTSRPLPFLASCALTYMRSERGKKYVTKWFSLVLVTRCRKRGSNHARPGVACLLINPRTDKLAVCLQRFECGSRT
jgi:hypothetical protein